MNKKQKNLRKGFTRLTLVLSIIGATVGYLIGLDIAGTYNPFITGKPAPYFLYGLQGALLGFASVWLLYFFIKYVAIPVIHFVKSGFEVK